MYLVSMQMYTIDGLSAVKNPNGDWCVSIGWGKG